MLVSILVPIYKVERYIERCARSLFEQTYSDLEYVFVNDCSPDRSMEILRQVVEDYPERKVAVKIFNHEKNKGVVGTRNTAFDNAKGEFVTIVDSDDWLELNAIGLLVSKQLETKADIVSGGRIAHSIEGDSIIPLKRCETSEEMAYHMMEASNDQYIWGRLIRRKILEDNNIRGIEGFDCAEDRFLMTKVSYYARSFEYVDCPIYHYECRNVTSIMYLMKSDVRSWFRTGCQEISNYVVLESFFNDKEVLLLNRCKECKDNILEYHLYPSMEWIIKTSLRKDYDAIQSLIDRYPLIHPYLNWPQAGSARRNYCFMKGLWTWRWIRRKAQRFVSKRWKKLISNS